MSKPYREEQEAILWQLEDASFESGKQGGEDVEAIRKDNVVFALESLQVLHEREVTEARISELRRIVVLLPSRYSQDLLDRIHEIRNDAKRAGLKEES